MKTLFLLFCGLGPVISLAAVGTVPSMKTQTETTTVDSIPYPWSQIEITDYRMKPGFNSVEVPPPRDGVPIWIPIGGGMLVSGGIVYLLTRKEGDRPTPAILLVQDDQVSVPCGQVSTFNPLLNDQGEGLRITQVTTNSGVSFDWQGNGTISLPDLSIGEEFTLQITVEDRHGQTAQETAFITVSSPPLLALDDEFQTAFQTTVSGNVMDNDQGNAPTVINFSQVVGGQLTLLPTGEFTFTPLPDFTGGTEFTYTLSDACGQRATATVYIVVLEPDCSFTVTVTGRDANCGLADGQAEAVVSETGQYEYVWSDGQIGPAIINLQPGTYQVTVTEVNTACTAEGSVEIGEINTTYITDLQVVDGNCGTAGDILLTISTQVSPQLSVTVVSPEGDLSWLVEPGNLMLSDYLRVIAGEYIITVEDPVQGPDCAETVRLTVAEPTPEPGIRVLEIVPASSPDAADGALILLVDPFTVPPFLILLNGTVWGSTTTELITITGLISDTYLVQLMDEFGCRSNVLEVYVPFQDGVWHADLIQGTLILPPCGKALSGVEHPVREQTALLRGSAILFSLNRGLLRYQAEWWSLVDLRRSGQSGQISVQGAWPREGWALYNGPVIGYHWLPAMGSTAGVRTSYAYWATDLEYSPTADGSWRVAFRSAIGQQEGWWWQGALRVQVRW
ncbi:MAG: hypothetical protein D6772_06615 [Bacteroidetes bacterium]|nr:MAG: hypothetical protein D6772_06615 [Bacteroidota bacterium]